MWDLKYTLLHRITHDALRKVTTGQPMLPDLAICPIILFGHANCSLKIKLNTNDVIVRQQRIPPAIAVYILKCRKKWNYSIGADVVLVYYVTLWHSLKCQKAYQRVNLVDD